MDEELWPEENIADELNKSLALIEDTRMEYNKSLSKIEAAGGVEPGNVGSAPAPLFENRPIVNDGEKPFSYWLKVGVAVTLPLVVVIVLIAAVLIVLQTSYLM